jgi:hypothetical protein
MPLLDLGYPADESVMTSRVMAVDCHGDENAQTAELGLAAATMSGLGMTNALQSSNPGERMLG